MRKTFYLLLASILLCSHDLYVKMETYILQPNQAASLSLYNGTFEKSENIITRDRMLDASLVVQGQRLPITADLWEDQDSTITKFRFDTGEAGTYVAGVSTKARNIELAAEKFNDYLKHDGVWDMLESRKEEGVLDQDAVESYQKHVKAIYQVGDVKTEDWKTVLGYPIEFVPQVNPYDRYTGEKLEIQLLLDGQPLPNQLVIADYLKSAEAHRHDDHEHDHDHDHDHDHSHDHGEKHEHEHDHEGKHSHDEHEHDHEGEKHSYDDGHDHSQDSKNEDTHSHTSGQQLRTNEQGIISLDLPEDGIYFLRTIHMTTAPDSEELTHRSKWATLTFEVTHKHGSSTHTHDDHDHEEGIPSWAFALASLLIIGILYLLFSKKD